MKTKTLFVRSLGALLAVLSATACSTGEPSQELTGTAVSALGTSGLFHTGESNTATLIDGTTADPHYQVTYSNDPAYSSASLAAPLNAWAVGIQATYVPKDTTNIAQWISVVQTTGKAASATPYVYTYSLFFATPAASNLTLVGLPLTWACDDDCRVFLNLATPAIWTSPNPLASLTAGYNAKHATVLNVSGVLNAASAQNRLDFCINNSGGWETGLFVGQLGCGSDADCCPGASCAIFCHNPSTFCAQKLANRTAIPTVTGHAPALTGTCSDPVGTAVCTSGVCSQVNNLCGYEDGHVCLGGAAQCQSGTCTGGVCGPSACAKDADCNTAQYCNIGNAQCAPKIDFGQAMPADTGRTPAFDGKCSSTTGATEAPIVCKSGVCDPADELCGYANGDGTCNGTNVTTVCRSGACDPTDGKCGYANGDGTCTAVTQGTVCRSSVCDPDGKCGYANGDGTCTDATAGAVCRSSVCDPDGKCGYANGDGTCTAATQSTVCRSGVCDPDGKCGYANGDGTCTAATQGVVCRSGTCSAAGVCIPGPCTKDADCDATAQFCLIATGQCTAKVDFGKAMPSDSGRTPVFDGKCSSATGATEAPIVCKSAVCDTADELCGYANGDGSCTAVSGAKVCRSGVCDPDGKCGYANGDGTCTTGSQCRSGTCGTAGVCVVPPCTKDADCNTTAQFCLVATGQCTAKVDFGNAMPSDSGRTPAFDGKCSSATGGTEAPIVCKAAVCDTTDELCGYANGDGSCTAASGATVCRSGVCDPDGKCGYANGDGSCTAANAATVCRAGVCDPDGKCGYANGDGSCTAANAATVCRAGVCDPDGKCGYANGDGTCTTGSQCRSGTCGTAGVCVVPPCTKDADCNTTAQFCLVAAGQCTAKVDFGKAMPSDSGRTPAFDGKCSSATGATEAPIVCKAAVCDTHDELCGYANNDGSCTAANAATVCRSGVCDADGKCGYANGDGSCTAASGATVCRSGVCDADGKCGYANGDGPCTSANATAVCRSAQCSTAGVCSAAGCAADSDCDAATQYCSSGSRTCVPKLANGTPMAVDTGHAPALNGTCPTPGASTEAAISCLSGVCDSDGKCGYSNGSGPCTSATVCRSAVCDTDQKCGLVAGHGPCVDNTVCRNDQCSIAAQTCASGCTSDADCTATDYCSTEGACTPKKPTGKPCAGTHECQSSMCNQQRCDSLVASGSGLVCTMTSPGLERRDAVPWLFLVVACVGLRRKRR